MDLISLGFSRTTASIIREQARKVRFDWKRNPDLVLEWLSENQDHLPTWPKMDRDTALEICEIAALGTELLEQVN